MNRRKTKKPVNYSLGVLTDGSEYAGHGTVFFTLWKYPFLENHDDNKILARYAISGLSSMTARLAADLKVKLQKVRVVTCPTHSSAAGLPALLLNQSQAGVASLHVCGGPGIATFAETVASIILRNKAYPQVATCEVPKYNKIDSLSHQCWWKLYQDEYVIIHGSSSREGSDESAILLLYTVSDSDGNEALTFCIIPPDTCSGFIRALQQLPVKKNLDFCICLNPDIVPPLQDHCDVFLCTLPHNNGMDEGLLVHAAAQSRYLHRILPKRFPVTDESPPDAPPSLLKPRTPPAYLIQGDVRVYRLESGACWVPEDEPKECPFAVIQMNPRLSDKQLLQTSHDIPEDLADPLSGDVNADENEIKIDNEDDDDSVTSLENGVLLDEPQLLVLGTGCASPSPLRGASGYALFLPTIMENARRLSLGAVFECGEGFLTSLRRHLPLNETTLPLLDIQFIWISHAHLDHYGGLPCLVREIHKARQACACHTNKRKRGNENSDERVIQPPIVIAPAVVLKLLDAALPCTRGFPLGASTATSKPYFIGVTHQEFDACPTATHIRRRIFSFKLFHGIQSSVTEWYQPFSFLQSIPVEHCPQAHALLLGLHFPNQHLHRATTTSTSNSDTRQNLPFLLCYSGDTRPCKAVVQTCQSGVSLLIHEATFASDERGVKEAIEKRHSTVAEALDIATQTNADSCLLTHFSQRYPRLPPDYNCCHRQFVNFCFASDGLLLPLLPTALSKLAKLNKQMVAALKCLQENVE